MNGGWIFLIFLVLAIIGGIGGFFAYKKYFKPRRLGRSNASTLPYASPAASSVTDKIKDVWNRIRNPKSQSGAGYEATSGGGAGGGGYRGSARARGGPLDPDEAWDSRVGNEADVYGPGGYYEEQELGSTSYTGGSGGGFRQAETLGAEAAGGGRGRSKSPGGGSNPFGDDQAASMRGVSPRPHLDTAAAATRGVPKGANSAESSPTFERRSIFRENV